MLNAQLAPIEEPRSRRGPLGFLRSAIDAVRGRDAVIRPPVAEPADFDLVLIGTPVWASHPSSPARSFARLYGQRIKRAAFFCTLGGSGAEPALRELGQALGRAPVATLTVTDRELDAGSFDDKLTSFANAVRSGMATA